MKKRILVPITTILVTALNVHAQGDVIFDNFGGGLVNQTDNFQSCPLPLSAGIVVQLYASMTAKGTPTAVPGSIVPVGIPADGYFDGGVVRIPASIIAAGAAAFMEVRAWEAAYGATFEEAVANTSGRPARRGISNRFTVASTGNPNASPPGVPVPLSDLVPGFYIGGSLEPCPEPSMIALSLLGVGLLALWRGRGKEGRSSFHESYRL